jgi:hypothetical protein
LHRTNPNPLPAVVSYFRDKIDVPVHFAGEIDMTPHVMGPQKDDPAGLRYANPLTCLRLFVKSVVGRADGALVLIVVLVLVVIVAVIRWCSCYDNVMQRIFLFA